MAIKRGVLSAEGAGRAEAGGDDRAGVVGEGLWRPGGTRLDVARAVGEGESGRDLNRPGMTRSVGGEKRRDGPRGSGLAGAVGEGGDSGGRDTGRNVGSPGEPGAQVAAGVIR